MHTKILKSHTIVPSSLYVRREADRLLMHIINDMGRPGYVLVARQMGKTNLLLNAKRTLPNNDDIYVYIDLSNSFRDARECFRYVIDLILETNEEKLYFLNESINQIRSKSDKVDHIEHLFELRKILQVIKGKLVIILDEVDALTKVNFSDTIFKQIRSIYFSRTNYPDLERLTYILSGVAEPASLIKDPKISPFNIGQNIFLGDFNQQEYEEFITKSGLLINTESIERIYYWTNGNPRMTYDLCSYIEDVLNLKGTISISDVDQSVQELYLSKYDQAPIDHIRGLIEKDEEMLQAVIDIKSNESHLISKSVKRRLYLAGIVGADFDSNYTTIKNRIIEESLSEEWINELRNNESSLTEKVSKAFSNQDYDSVIILLESLLESISPSDKNYALYENLILSSYFNLSRYDSISEYFNRKRDNILSNENEDILINRLDSIYLCALSLYYLNDFNSAVAAFATIVSLKRNDILYFRSLLNLGSALHQSNSNDFSLSSIEVYNRAVNELSELHPQIKSAEVLQLRNILYYNMGRYYYDENKNSLAKDNLSKALNLGVSASRPPILHLLILLSDNDEQRKTYLAELVDYIIENQLKPQDFSPDNYISLSYLLLLNIFNISLELDSSYAIKLALYALSVDLRISNEMIKRPLFQTLRTSNIENISKDSLYVKIFSKISDSLLDSHVKHGYKVFKESKSMIIHKVGAYFIEPIIDRKLVNSFDDSDLMHYCVLLNHTIDAGNITLSEKLLNVLETGYFSLSKHSFENILSSYYKMRIMAKLSKHDAVLINAKHILKTFSSNNPAPFLFLNEESMDAIKESAAKTYSGLWALFENKKILDIKDRNKKVTVVYKSGKLVSEKYKKIEHDIKSLECIIISD